MLGGLVNAIWRPLQSIGQSIAHAGRSPSKVHTEQREENDGPTSSDRELTNHQTAESTPIKSNQNAGFPHANLHSSGDPFVTPMQPSQQQQSNAFQHQQPFQSTFIPTPSLTPVPKLLFKRSDLGARPRGAQQQNGRMSVDHPAAGRKNRFSVGAGMDEDGDHDNAEHDENMEDKENVAARKKRGAASTTAGGDQQVNAPDPLETETGHAIKKPRTEFTQGAVTNSPRRTRKSGAVASKIASVPTASLFDFGPLNVLPGKAPLFAHKPSKAKATKGQQNGTAAGTKGSAAGSSQSVQAPSIALASSLGGFQISAPSTYPQQQTHPTLSHGSVSIKDIPVDTDVIMQDESPRHAQPPQHHTHSHATNGHSLNGGQRALSPTSTIGHPLGELTITPPIILPNGAFQGMSLRDVPNPFQQQPPMQPMNGHANGTTAASSSSTSSSDDPTRLRAVQKSDRDARRKDVLSSLRTSRKLEEYDQEEKERGNRGDIKSRTKLPTAPLNPAHVPIRQQQQQQQQNGFPTTATTAPAGAPVKVKPPVPLFWESQQHAQQATQQPHAPGSTSTSHSHFTPLVPDADFAMDSSSDSSPPAPKFPLRTGSSGPSSLPVKDRVPLTHSASFRATIERDSIRRKQREEAHAQAAKDAREKLLRERREAQAAQAEAQRASEERDAAQTQAQAAALAHQQQQQQHAAETAAAAAAYAARQIRRSARHSSSPSPSPPPETPSPRNRFVSPVAATPATPMDTSGERRTRASMRASPPVASPDPSQPSPRSRAAQQAEHLAQSIAARKAADAASAAQRIKERQASLQASERAADRAQKEKDEWRSIAARRIAQRARGKGYEGLLREFAPSIRDEMTNVQAQQYEGLRKAMRKAMAKFHPDKHAGSPPKNQLEAEETFILLKKAYDELTTLCR